MAWAGKQVAAEYAGQVVTGLARGSGDPEDDRWALGCQVTISGHQDQMA